MREAERSAELRVLPAGSRAVLRLKAWSPEIARGKGVVIGGQALPTEVGAKIGGRTRVLCVGPAEWLIVSEEDSAAAVHERVQSELGASGLAAADLSEALVTFQLSGSRVRDVLSMGCGLDFHPRAFPPGRCARTRLAQIPVIFEC